MVQSRHERDTGKDITSNAEAVKNSPVTQQNYALRLVSPCTSRENGHAWRFSGIKHHDGRDYKQPPSWNPLFGAVDEVYHILYRSEPHEDGRRCCNPSTGLLVFTVLSSLKEFLRGCSPTGYLLKSQHKTSILQGCFVSKHACEDLGSALERRRILISLAGKLMVVAMSAVWYLGW